MLGIALLAMGAVLLWAAFTKRGDAIIDALKMNLPAGIDFDPRDLGLGGGGGGSGGGGGGKSGGGGGGTDSGSHMGIDANGNVYEIPKNYGDMSDQEKDDANDYAHNIGNLGSGNP